MKKIFLNRFSSKFNPFGKNPFNQLKDISFFRAKGRSQSVWLSIGLGIFCSFYLLKNKVNCIQRQKSEAASVPQQNEVQIYQLNKYQFLQLLTNVNEEGLLVVFNKYFRNEKEKQFAQKLEKLYNQAKELKVNKIYLIEKNDIKHLQTFEKWLKNQKSEEKQDGETNNENSSKIEYFFLTPYFKNNPFKLQEEQHSQEVQEIRKYRIRLNPVSINEQIFDNYRNLFNLTTIIKQCPDYIQPGKQNECIEDYRSKIATLIEQKMLKNKSDEFVFYALTPNSKKDFSPLITFHNILKSYKDEQKPLSEGQTQEIYDFKKSQNTYALRNDLLGRQIDNMKDFKRRNYSALKSLSSYEKFLLFIRPRVFIVSKANSSIDLYWYVTCLHKNKQPTISINNTDSFNLGRKYPITDGLSYPQNVDLEFLKVLYKNHPYLNFLIVNTEIVSQLIRHLPVKKKFSIFNLTSDLIYPKMFLPHYDGLLCPSENYEKNFKPLIEKYLAQPKNYDSVVLDKEKKINRKELEDSMKKTEQKFLLRVCNLNCQQDIDGEKLKMAYKKLKLVQKVQNLSKNQNDSNHNYPQNWQNDVYRNTYWIDSYFNNVGLKDGDYIFSEGKFQQL